MVVCRHNGGLSLISMTRMVMVVFDVSGTSPCVLSLSLATTVMRYIGVVSRSSIPAREMLPELLSTTKRFV